MTRIGIAVFCLAATALAHVTTAQPASAQPVTEEALVRAMSEAQAAAESAARRRADALRTFRAVAGIKEAAMADRAETRAEWKAAQKEWMDLSNRVIVLRDTIQDAEDRLSRVRAGFTQGMSFEELRAKTAELEAQRVEISTYIAEQREKMQEANARKDELDALLRGTPAGKSGTAAIPSLDKRHLTTLIGSIEAQAEFRAAAERVRAATRDLDAARQALYVAKDRLRWHLRKDEPPVLLRVTAATDDTRLRELWPGYHVEWISAAERDERLLHLAQYLMADYARVIAFRKERKARYLADAEDHLKRTAEQIQEFAEWHGGSFDQTDNAFLFGVIGKIENKLDRAHDWLANTSTDKEGWAGTADQGLNYYRRVMTLPAEVTVAALRWELMLASSGRLFWIKAGLETGDSANNVARSMYVSRMPAQYALAIEALSRLVNVFSISEDKIIAVQNPSWDVDELPGIGLQLEIQSVDPHTEELKNLLRIDRTTILQSLEGMQWFAPGALGRETYAAELEGEFGERTLADSLSSSIYTGKKPRTEPPPLPEDFRDLPEYSRWTTAAAWRLGMSSSKASAGAIVRIVHDFKRKPLDPPLIGGVKGLGLNLAATQIQLLVKRKLLSLSEGYRLEKYLAYLEDYIQSTFKGIVAANEARALRFDERVVEVLATEVIPELEERITRDALVRDRSGFRNLGVAGRTASLILEFSRAVDLKSVYLADRRVDLRPAGDVAYVGSFSPAQIARDAKDKTRIEALLEVEASHPRLPERTLDATPESVAVFDAANVSFDNYDTGTDRSNTILLAPYVPPEVTASYSKWSDSGNLYMSFRPNAYLAHDAWVGLFKGSETEMPEADARRSAIVRHRLTDQDRAGEVRFTVTLAPGTYTARFYDAEDGGEQIATAKLVVPE